MSTNNQKEHLSRWENTVGESLRADSFKASNGWLTRWKARYNISHRVSSGESGDVRSDTVDSWLERIPSIVDGYDARDLELR